MTTVFVGQQPPEVQALLERRRALGLDARDEVWNGVYHVVPSAHSRHGDLQAELAVVVKPMARRMNLHYISEFNLGVEYDYRVPDFGVFASRPSAVWLATALIVGEILSPDDETFAKLDFYAAHGVREVWVVDPDRRQIAVHHPGRGHGGITAYSEVLGTDLAEVARHRIDWP